MFGMNKKGKDKEPKPFFEFPLQKDIQNPDKLKEMMESAEKQILHLKKAIQTGAKPEEYEQLGTLLHAYSALLKVFNAVPTKNK
ncbi:MAG: hypothetical protein SP4CHLAM5_09690 [Chlamydiia bacterium]|nr:hypothetical protein [Chlamydiia bacterium]MCH9618827.1 hypothetical protein [Chlamydiia bacterium]MCH9624371.1 hypothetical protein [Chlamydiia bacterium]